MHHEGENETNSTIYGILCHVRNDVIYYVLRHILGYIVDEQLHHKCDLMTVGIRMCLLGMSMFKRV